MKQLRIYTLKDEMSANNYFENHWREHLKSLPIFGIAVNNVYQGVGHHSNKVFAVVSYIGAGSPAELTKKFMESNNFKEDMKGFNFSDLLSVEEFLITEPLF